jgi:ubiquinol-cytochrome c reductase cytochrome c1 subunit
MIRLTIKKYAGLLALAAVCALAVPQSGMANEEGIKKQDWTFAGMFGTFDKAQLQRGYKVYSTVCAQCHGLTLLHYRNLGDADGPAFSKEEIEKIAAEAQVQDGPNDEGAMFTRPGKPNDFFVPRFKNDKEAAAMMNGSVPPDLSVITKARGIEREASWYMTPVNMLRDVVSQYQEQGPDYIYALLNGYEETPPAGVTLSPGASYNKVFPGHQIAMPQPLTDGVVEYTDGTPATVSSYSKDVISFLMWSAEPKLVERKRMGLYVMGYLLVLAAVLYLSKRAIWRSVKH